MSSPGTPSLHCRITLAALAAAAIGLSPARSSASNPIYWSVPPGASIASVTDTDMVGSLRMRHMYQTLSPDHVTFLIGHGTPGRIFHGGEFAHVGSAQDVAFMAPLARARAGAVPLGAPGSVGVCIACTFGRAGSGIPVAKALSGVPEFSGASFLAFEGYMTDVAQRHLPAQLRAALPAGDAYFLTSTELLREYQGGAERNSFAVEWAPSEGGRFASLKGFREVTHANPLGPWSVSPGKRIVVAWVSGSAFDKANEAIHAEANMAIALRQAMDADPVGRGRPLVDPRARIAANPSAFARSASLRTAIHEASQTQGLRRSVFRELVRRILARGR